MIFELECNKEMFFIVLYFVRVLEYLFELMLNLGFDLFVFFYGEFHRVKSIVQLVIFFLIIVA